MNSILCKICGDILESYHSHDFKRCFCGNVAIDGGPEYKNRIGSSLFIHEIESIGILQTLASFSFDERVGLFHLDVPAEIRDDVVSMVEKAKLNRILLK